MKTMKSKLTMRTAALIFAAAAATGLSGCSDIGFGEQVLLRPPRATGDKAAIQTAIEGQAGGSYTLKYPQKGQYRSAITMFDIAGGEYALAFYSTDSDSKLNVSVIAGKDEQWDCIGSFSNKGTGVDRVIFKDVNNDGKEDIIVGWNNYATGRNTLSIYSVENNAVREMTVDETYNEMMLADITGDKSEDLVIITLSTAQSGSNLLVMQYSDQEKRPIGKYAVELDPEVKEFTGVFYDKIDSGVNGIILDGEKAGSMRTTQVVYFDKADNELKNPLLTVSENDTYSNPTTRKDVISARDFDSDGIVEVPVITPLSASPKDKAGAVCSLTSWKQLRTNDGSLQTKMNTVINYNDGYYFIMPDAWTGNVTALSDPAKREVSYYVWNSKTGSVGDKILSIERFGASDIEQAKKDGYVPLGLELSDGTDAVIAAKLFKTNTSDELNLDQSELEKCIKAL